MTRKLGGRISKIFAICFCAILVLTAVSVLIFLDCMQRSKDYVKFDKRRLTEVCTTLTVLDDDGCVLREALSCDDKKQIPLSALHKYTYGAFIAVEDKRFFSHDGLDGRRILGAVLHNIKSGSFKEGASTISQQLIKNTHLDNKKSIRRKINEMLLALELEQAYTKEEILEMYLNTIYFGRNAYGIESAANVYFDKSARDLTVSESAVLAGMIKAPNNYAPDKNAEKCKKRRDLVLKLMSEQQIISQEQYQTAVASAIDCRPYRKIRETSYVNLVIDEACRVLNMSETQLFHSDFIIETYFDKSTQQALDTFVLDDMTKNIDGSLADLACVICNREGGVSACYFRGEGALSRKQIGSTAKPIAVYAPALCEKLITQASPVLDEPTDFGGYKPANAGGYAGWTTVKTAVAKSLNVPAVKTLNTLGLKNAQKYLEKLGFRGEQNLSLALGNINGGMTATELANCYATLANGGINNGVRYIRCITGPNGEIYRRKPLKVKVFDEASAYLMTDLLKNAVTNGTAKALKNSKAEIAAKTGTVGNEKGNAEALVAGYTSEHTFVFWYSGNFSNDISGGTAPCKLAARVLARMYCEKNPRKFSIPDGIVRLAIDQASLYQDQQVKPTVDGDGENFLFACDNLPQQTGKIKRRLQDEKTAADEKTDNDELMSWDFWLLPKAK